VYEKVHTAVTASFAEATGMKRRLIDWALDVGRRESALRREHRPVPRALALQRLLADRLVFAKVKERLGGRLRLPISGGAPLAPEIAELFDALGVSIIEGYGLTECTTAATTNRTDNYRFGTVGQALPGFELRLADDGELLIRSETVFAGYFKEPEATAEVLDGDGWLRTGDIATIDDDGFVTITDRKKDIIVTAGGKNIAPQPIENKIKTNKYVSQAVMIGDRRKYPVVLVVPNWDQLEKWAKLHNILWTERAQLLAMPTIHAKMEKEIFGECANLARYEMPKKVGLLEHDFSIERGELTPTLKVKRRVIDKQYKALIDSLYESGDREAEPVHT
jgi:long-chain acyl-CoA synthetase